MPLTTEYQNQIHPVNQVALDVASENLVPSSVWLQHVQRTEMPSDTQTKSLRKKGELAREVLPENTSATIQEYIETDTLLNVIKSAVVTRHTVEARDFSPGGDIPSVLGMEAAKALAVGADEDIAVLISGATSSITAAGANLTLLEILACGLNVKISTRGNAVRNGAGLTFVGSSKQVFDALITGALDPATSLNLEANPNSSLGGAIERAGAQQPLNGFYDRVAGVDFYETEIVDDDTVNYFGAIFDRSRAFVGMWSDSVNAMDENDVLFFRMLRGMYWYSDFAIHWDEAICRIESPL